MTVGLIDNDIFLKLVAFRIFDEATASLSLEPTDLRILETARFVFYRYQSQQRYYSSSIWQQAIERVQTCQTIPVSSFATLPTTQWEAEQLKQLREQIHPGEATLIAAAYHEADFLLLSGDKNCLTALPQVPTKIYSRLAGRVICLELLLQRLIDQLGYETLRDRIKPTLQYDKTAKICFGYSQPATESEARQALQSYIDEIQHLAPGLLADLS